MVSIATLEEYQKFIANEPESQREIRTIEAYHPQFSKVERFANNYTPLTAGIEAGAPRNAGEMVTYEAATLQIEDPAERNDTDQVLSISMGATDDRLNDILNQISGSGYLQPVEIVYRKYYSNDLSVPATPPLYVYMSAVTYENADSATITAEDADLATKRSGAIYTIEDYQGLARD